MQATPEHLRAIIAHVADVLGAQQASRAADVITAMVGEEPSYADLGAIDTVVVSEALRDASVSIPALRRASIAQTFRFAVEGARTCNRCGRFAARLDGSVWQTVTGDVCPVDQGLYVTVERSPVISWTDGRSYPYGTTHDADRVPIDEAAIRASRRVDPEVLAACAEFGVSIVSVCAALRAGSNVAEVLRIIENTSLRFHDTTAVRQFVSKAKAPKVPTPSAEPIQTASSVSSSEVLDAMIRLLPSQFDEIVFRLGINPSTLPGYSSSLAERAVAVVRLCERQGRLSEVAALLGISQGGPVVYREVWSGPNSMSTLRDKLVKLYPYGRSVRVLMSDVDPAMLSHVDFAGTINSVMFSAIDEAQKRGVLQELVERVRQEYPRSGV